MVLESAECCFFAALAVVAVGDQEIYERVHGFKNNWICMGWCEDIRLATDPKRRSM